MGSSGGDTAGPCAPRSLSELPTAAFGLTQSLLLAPRCWGSSSRQARPRVPQGAREQSERVPQGAPVLRDPLTLPPQAAPRRGVWPPHIQKYLVQLGDLTNQTGLAWQPNQPNWVSWYPLGGTPVFPVKKTLVQESILELGGELNRLRGPSRPKGLTSR